MAEGRLYITTPIYYVNDQPHIGHTYTTVLADVLARYHRLFGYEVKFMTGTDEHGQKVQQSALARGLSPQQQCDEYSQRFKEMWSLFEIVYDRFIRTTEEDHKRTVQALLQKLYDQGDIFKHTYTGWYNVSDEMFISESDVTEEGKQSGRIIQVSEENYFFRLSKYQDWLARYINEENPDFIQPESRRNEVLGLLRQPVNDLCISRPKSRLSWGIEMPFDPDYVTYVWVDALINYISGIGWPDSPEFSYWWPDALHLIGKDILKPHGFFWPILLHAAGVGLPKKLLAHGWWTRGGQKEAKTVTKALAAQAPVRHIREMATDYGVGSIRYFLIREMTPGMDQDYSEEMIVTRLNSDLANDLGNLVSRVTKLVRQNFNSLVPAEKDCETDPRGQELIALANGLSDQVRTHVIDLKPNLAVDALIRYVRSLNVYLTECEPWSRVKQGDLGKRQAAFCLVVALKGLYRVAVLLHPVMPRKMEALLASLGCSIEKDGLNGQFLARDFPEAGTTVPGGDPLFPRIDWKAIEQKIQALTPIAPEQPKGKAGNDASLISIDQFRQLDLRVAEVLEAEKVPKADKLLKLKIRIGEEVRQIVAGVAEFYRPEEMIGKKIIVVANLEPAAIRGLESRGMLLAAREGNQLTLLTLENQSIASGSKVS
ncbi:MAG: methionine--tRNA ligase [Candidatus Omnitrophica bacterium]|nr:methionine--tRNA ligase [bacterium]MCL4735013.1 methionine--tRNA ligase [Candidatus Omnitrophota bacterium]NUP94179.1 methionine--tRNA ligase [Candidatus Omnitrophota bacterium]